mgnify:FL=1
MSLLLIEASIKEEEVTQFEVKGKIEGLQAKLKGVNATLIEIQVSKDLSHLFFIIEAKDEKSTKQIVEEENFVVQLVKEVRLVGEDLDKVKEQKNDVNYLVEWNLPKNLTMEQYLNRKKQNSVHYSEVPEVAFARTYVCEDMTKCLCLYDAPDKAAVTRAREAVQAPIDSITELGKNNE